MTPSLNSLAGGERKTMRNDKLYNTTEVGKRLGGLHRNRVGELIRSGKLEAVILNISGNVRARYYVRRSELQRFIDSMKSHTPRQVEPVERVPKKFRMDTDIKKELAAAKEYY